MRASRALKFQVFQVASRSDLRVSFIFTYSHWSKLVESCVIICQFCWTTRWEKFYHDPVNRTGVRAILVGAKRLVTEQAEPTAINSKSDADWHPYAFIVSPSF